VNVVLVSFEDTKKRLSKARKIVLTGTPTKIKDNKLSETEKCNIKRNLGIREEMQIVLVFGGSQGAKSINEALTYIVKNKKNKDYQIIWACGQKQYDSIKLDLNKQNIEGTVIVPYIYNMEEMMKIADVIVSRSGAMTITEISKLGKPAIFIPFPFATENHQEYNARVLENVGAAKIILDKNLSGEILAKTLENMIKNKEKLAQMGQNAKKAAVYNVEDNIYNEIIKLVE
jgi:UDP-N-acetylglucosamine--N-acetylmuramyl-(pentapeptide) pyrophosphoryl-undecaprenol N-acetylglucosamine transferase